MAFLSLSAWYSDGDAIPAGLTLRLYTTGRFGSFCYRYSCMDTVLVDDIIFCRFKIQDVGIGHPLAFVFLVSFDIFPWDIIIPSVCSVRLLVALKSHVVVVAKS
jgi:hypothetical protein